MPSPTELKEQALRAFQADQLTDAADKFAAAAQAFADSGDPGAAAEMKNNLCVVYLAEKQWDAALAAVEGTPKVFHDLGDRLREAQALSNLAAAHDGAGRLDRAAELYTQAIDLFAALGEKENRAACLKALSALQIKQGKQFQALASMEAALNQTPKLTAREKTLKGLINQAMRLIRRG